VRSTSYLSAPLNPHPLMTDASPNKHQIHRVTNFRDLITTPFVGATNAICWERNLKGDFREIVEKVDVDENMAVLKEAELRGFQLSEAGQLARETLLQDLKRMEAQGASPVLNVIRRYDRDNNYPFFPTDVYSFHVDRSPVPVDTYLCTYHGAASDILPNAQAKQKVLIPEIRQELIKLYGGPEEGFEAFLMEYFFDLHYQAVPGAQPINLGIGHLWRLAIDHPGSQVLPCVHRAPKEKSGEPRLMMIC